MGTFAFHMDTTLAQHAKYDNSKPQRKDHASVRNSRITFALVCKGWYVMMNCSWVRLPNPFREKLQSHPLDTVSCRIVQGESMYTWLHTRLWTLLKAIRIISGHKNRLNHQFDPTVILSDHTILSSYDDMVIRLYAHWIMWSYDHTFVWSSAHTIILSYEQIIIRAPSFM